MEFLLKTSLFKVEPSNLTSSTGFLKSPRFFNQWLVCSQKASKTLAEKRGNFKNLVDEVKLLVAILKCDVFISLQFQIDSYRLLRYGLEFVDIFKGSGSIYLLGIFSLF